MSLMKRVAKAYKEERLLTATTYRLRHFLSVMGASKYLFHNPASTIQIHCPDYIAPDPSEEQFVRRIFEAFRKMKEDQSKVALCYLPSSLWEAHVNEAYSYLYEGLRENNLQKFHYFLSNFGSWKTYTGIDSFTFIRSHLQMLFGKLFLQNEVFLKQFKYWLKFYNGSKKISSLSYPIYGNQCGAYMDEVFVGGGSFFNEIYGSWLSGLVNDLKRPVVAELGAGFGKLAYFILRDFASISFVDFDLPEIVTVASYYLMKAFPDKKILLYGESDFSDHSFKEFDLIFMPPWSIEKIGDESVDLFLNKNSLGEMTKEAVCNYIEHIARTTRGYFFHMNHEVVRNVYEKENSAGLLGYEYPVPKNRFTILSRYPDIAHMMSQKFANCEMDIFTYLYGRKSQHLSVTQ